MVKNRNGQKKQVQKLNEIKYFYSSHNLRKAKEIMVVIGEVGEELPADLMFWKAKSF